MFYTPISKSMMDKVKYAPIVLTVLLLACKEQKALLSTHPKIAVKQWKDLFLKDLSNAAGAKEVWKFNDGILTAFEDRMIWSKESYENFIIDLEFLTEPGTNSGVIMYASDTTDWLSNSIEIQIADDYHEKWAKAPSTWHCGAIFGHHAPQKSFVNQPGIWNHFTIRCVGKDVSVILNGTLINVVDLSMWTSARVNPDGSKIPEWYKKPLAELPTKGRIGLQGKHGGVAIYFRNIKIKKLK